MNREYPSSERVVLSPSNWIAICSLAFVIVSSVIGTGVTVIVKTNVLEWRVIQLEKRVDGIETVAR